MEPRSKVSVGSYSNWNSCRSQILMSFPDRSYEETNTNLVNENIWGGGVGGG